MTFRVLAGRCAAAVGQTCLTLPGPVLPENDVHRGASAGRAGETDRRCRELGNRCAPAFRYLGLGASHQLGVSWHTVGHGIGASAARRIADTGRLEGVDALGIDENVWAHTGPPGTGIVTGIVDHTRDADGTVHGRLLDLVPGRSGKSYADWLKERGTGSRPGSGPAALDPFRGYANPIRDELPKPSPFWMHSMS
jgi:hypothetical protein